MLLPRFLYVFICVCMYIYIYIYILHVMVLVWPGAGANLASDISPPPDHPESGRNILGILGYARTS